MSVREAMVEALQAAHNLIANTAFDAGESHDWAVAVDEKIQAALLLSTEPGEAEETCPVCAKPFKPNDLCSTDIELGTCHAACLQGCPTVDLNTGEPISGPIPTYRYDEGAASPEGWILVPRDPTEFMIDNAEEAMQERRNFGLKIYAIDVWNAMLVAAPLPEDTHHGR